MSRWRHQKWTRIIFGMQIICSCFFCGFVSIIFSKDFHKELDFLSIANNVIKLGGAFIGYWIIFVESYCKRPVQRKFWQIYRQIRSDFCRSDHVLVFGNYFVKFGLFFIITAVIEVKQSLQLISMLNGTTLYFAFSYFALMIGHEMRVFHYLFFIHLLDQQLDNVGIEMKVLADASEIGTISRNHLKWIRMHYDLVYELSNCVNEVFGWSNIATVLYLFLQLVTDLNWTYWAIHNEMEVELQGIYI